jgi:hypothetical protein
MVINNSANISNLDFDFELDIAQQVPKAIVTDISTYIGNGANLIIGLIVKLIDPSNLQLPLTVYPPNVDIYPGLTDTSKNLPYFNGQVKYGTYKAYVTLIDSNGNQYVWTDSDGSTFKSINLCKPNTLSNATGNYGGLLLDVNPNCDTGMLEVQDGGTGFSYNGVAPTTTDASLVITYPIDTTGTTAQVTATFIPFTFPLTVSGIYSIVGTVNQTYQLTETTSVKAAYYYQNTFDVNCGYTICNALCDYEKLVTDVQSCSIKNPNEAYQQLKTLILVIAYLGKIAWFKNCGKKFGDVLEQLRLIAGFSCNCDCAPQGIAPAPLFNAGTIVKGQMCGDIDMNLTQFMGNIKMDLSDVSYSVVAAILVSDFVTITPTEGVCSKTFTISIDACSMLSTVSISCLSDVNTGSPAPTNGQALVWNSVAGEWQSHTISTPSSLLYSNWTPVTGTGVLKSYVVPANSLQSDGDELLVEGYLVYGGSSAVNFYFDPFNYGLVVALNNTTKDKAAVSVKITRVSATTIKVQSTVKYLDSSDTVTSETVSQSTSATTVSNLGSTNITVEFIGNGSPGGSTANYMDVKLFKL